MNVKTILIIDDDKSLRAVYRAALTSRGYSVVSASQGAEGVHLARRVRPHLILIDMRMPVMTGWDALQYLRTYPETRGIPICGMSAFLPADLLRSDLAPAFNAFLSKPIEPKELVKKAEELIGPP